MFGEVEVVRSLLQQSKDDDTEEKTDNIINLDVRDDNESTALHLASINGQQELVDVLVNAGASLHAQDVDGDTPLHCAAMLGHTEVCGQLLVAGAALCARNLLDQSALDYSMQMRQPAVEKFLRHELMVGALLVMRSAQGRKKSSSALRRLPQDLCRLLADFLV